MREQRSRMKRSTKMNAASSIQRRCIQTDSASRLSRNPVKISRVHGERFFAARDFAETPSPARRIA